MKKRFFVAQALAVCALSKLLIIPVLAQAATPVQPVWLNASTPDDQLLLETLAGFTERDQLFVSGISGESIAVNGFFGESSGVPGLTPTLSLTARDAQLFHSEFDRHVRYSGATVSGMPVQGWGWSAGVAQVESATLPERLNWFGSLRLGQADIQAYRIQVNSRVAAHAMNLTLKLPLGRLGARHMQAQDGTRSSVAQWQLPVGKGRTFALEFSDGSSRRFNEGNYQRWMLSYAGHFDVTSPLWASEGSSSGLGIVSTAVLVAGAVALAVVATSGDDTEDQQLRFGSQSAAARHVLNETNPASVAQNVEYGGWVYRNADATFSATEPRKGTIDSVNIGSPEDVPYGRATASYHTHGAYDPRYDSENFSTVDISINNVWKTDGYLATPSGAFKYHNFLTGVVTTLGTIAN
jgi:hypothetical protein